MPAKVACSKIYHSGAKRTSPVPTPRVARKIKAVLYNFENMMTAQTEQSVDAATHDSGGAREAFQAAQVGRRTIALACAALFLLAFGVRFLTLQDSALEAGKVQTAVTGDYKYVARLLGEGGIAAFFSPASPLANPDTLGHPPGYSIFIAFVARFFGESDRTLQLIQIACDAAAVVVLLLIASELVPFAVALLAALLCAYAPQFAWNSVIVLPDTLAVLPLLLAVYCIVRATRRPRLALLLAAGALVGLSCWLRANAMLFAPFLAVVVVPLAFARGVRLRFAAALMAGTLLVVVPLTARNAIVFGHLIPLSLGAGQTLLEGIADYDREARFGIPATDLGIMRQEAETYGRPRYAETLFGADGVERERARLRRGFAVIRAHPLWFASVMVRRAASMLKLERARRVAAVPPVTQSLAVAEGMQPVWSKNAAELAGAVVLHSPRARIALDGDGQTLRVEGDDAKYGKQSAFMPFDTREDTDYLLTVPVKVERGRVGLAVENDGRRDALASTIVDAVEGRTPEEQPTTIVQMPFVSTKTGRARVVLSNIASARPSARLGQMRLYELGAASGVWTRYPRAVVANIQKLFLTAVMLPLALFGLALLVRARAYRALVLLLAVPAYFLCVQSLLHTEYRYVLAIHYFLFTLAAVALYWAGKQLRRGVRWGMNAWETESARRE